MLVTTALITVLITVFDYVLPTWSTKKFGGNKASQQGAAIGTIAGIFAGPYGIILGPLIGAFIGAVITQPTDLKSAVKAAIGSFIGFLLSTGIKLIWCMILAWWFIKELF